MKRFRGLLFCLLLLITGCQNNQESVVDGFEVQIKEISKYGNVVLDLNIEEFVEKDIEVADIIDVAFNDTNFEMPVGTQYSDVDTGKMICRFDEEDDEVIIAISYGDFATESGFFNKEEANNDEGYQWNYNEDLKIVVSLKEKQGYKDEYEIKQLVRTNERVDYPNLSDEEYANFRVAIEGLIYRSSSPIDPDLNRNTYADEALKQSDVKTVINIADEADEMLEYEEYDETYYSSLLIKNFEMNYDFKSEEFKTAIKGIIETLINEEGPFLIHCKEGKDRTGIVCALLEAFYGYSIKDIQEDYMLTYYNYYGVEKGSDKYDLIIKTNLNKALCSILDVTDLYKIDLKAAANDYFLAIGVDEEAIAKLNDLVK